MPITPLPTPPSRDDPVNFASRADSFMTALPNFATDANALAVAVNNNATAASQSVSNATAQAVLAQGFASNASSSASAALTSKNLASESQTAAAASAASAAALAGAFVGTSTSSLTIGLGTKSFTTQTGEQYTSGIWITAVSSGNASNYMFGQVTSYSGSLLVVNIQATGGSGTLADWNLSLAGVRGPAGEGVTPQAIGFTLTAGTTVKTLTVDTDVTASQLVTLAGSQTLSNKALASPNVTGRLSIGGSYGSSGQVLMSQGSSDPVWSTPSSGNLNVFSSSGTWTKPSGVNFIRVEAWGAGGGGGSGQSGAVTTAAGGGGGGGGCTIAVFPASTVASSVAVLIGAGGSGGASVTGTTSLIGNTGGDTTFGSYLRAVGGSGGTIATYNAGGYGGGNGFSTTAGYGSAGGAQSGTQGRGNHAEYGGGSGGAGNVSNQLWGAGGGNSQWGGPGGAGGCPVNNSNGSYALPAGSSTDTLLSFFGGAACGVNGSAGGSGVTPFRDILPVGGGGGGGGSSAQSFGQTGRLRVWNGTVIVPATLGYYYSNNDGSNWAYEGMNGFPVDFCYLNGYWYCLLNRDSIGYIGKGTTLSNLTFTQVGSITNGTGLATDGISILAVMGQYSNRYYSVWKSTDAATTWTETIFSTNNNDGFSYFTYASGFFFISSTFTGVSVYSPDCSAGSFVGTSNGVYQKRSYGMSKIGGLWVSAYAGSTSNGIWTGATEPNQETNALNGVNLYDVIANTAIAVAVGDGGAIYSSTNGSTWTSRTSGTSDQLTNVVWTGTKFIAMTNQNQFRTYTSTNGTTWSSGAAITSGAFFNAGVGGAGGLAAGGGGGGGGYSGYNSGAGGAGGNGYLRVYSW
jgi:hypothetical protein